MYLLTVHNHMNVVTISFDLDPDPTCILESKVVFLAPNYKIT